MKGSYLLSRARRLSARQLGVLAVVVAGLILASTVADAAVTYGAGFEWTFYDQTVSDGDWVDADMGRTSPATWAGNPSADAYSIADPANAGKSTGSDSTALWYYMREPSGSTSEPKTLLEQGAGFGQTGYWYNNQGFYKNNRADGVGTGDPMFANQSDQWLSIGFQVPATGTYTAEFKLNNDGVANRIDHGTTTIASGGVNETLSATEFATQGDYLYFHSHGGWPGVQLLTVTLLYTGSNGHITGNVMDASSNAPILGAEVRAEPGGLVAFTDSTGAYDLSVPAGTYSITTEANCYASSTVENVTVAEGGVESRDFALTATGCSENLALTAYATAMKTDSSSDPSYGIDGTRGTAYKSGWSDSWYQLNWDAPITFTKLKIYATGSAPLYEDNDRALVVQRWDTAAEGWFDVVCAGNSAAVSASSGHVLFELTTPGGFPVATSQLRLTTVTWSKANLQVEEFEVYNTEVTTASISGVVTDAASEVPRAYVDVATTDGQYSTFTGPDGVYHLSVPAGTYDLTATRTGFESQTIAGIVVGTDEQVTGNDFALARTSSANIALYADPHADGQIAVYPEMQAIDGNASTIWNASWDATTNASFYLDWGTDVRIGRVAFKDSSNRITGWSLQVWDSASMNWTELTIGSGASADYSLGGAVNASKLRLQYLADPGSPPNLTELAVYGVIGTAGTIRGTVRDASSNPIAGALVTSGNGYSATTDDSGNYVIVVPTGTFSLTASKEPSYSTQTVEVTVVDGQVLEGVDFTLTLIAPNLASSATFSGSVTDSSSSTTYGNDGDRETAWIAGWADGWCQLTWPSPVTFTKSRLYMLGRNFIYSDANYYGIIFQKWDDDHQVWTDWYSGHASDAVEVDGDYMIETDSPASITTSKVRCGFACWGIANMQVSEWEVYCTPWTGSSVSGVVTSSNGLALQHAQVASGGTETYTDCNGAYSLALPAGTHDITVSRTGYDETSLTGVALAEGENLTGRDVVLSPASGAALQTLANSYVTSYVVTGYPWVLNDGSAGSLWQGAYPGLTDTAILDWGSPVTFQRVRVPDSGMARNATLHLYSWNSSTSDWTSLVDVSGNWFDLLLPVPVTTSKVKLVVDGVGPYPVVVPEIDFPVTEADFSVAKGKLSADGTAVSADDWLVSAVFADGFYAQAPDRSCGIRVTGTHAVNVGDEVRFAGAIASLEGERVVNPWFVAVLSSDNSVDPLATNNKSVGGGTQGLSQGVTGGTGTNNLGLLLRTTGTVKAMQVIGDQTDLWIDDGSAVPAEAAGGVRYGDGFRWTLFDIDDQARGDWGDAAMGRSEPGTWAGNPTVDSGSLSDAANAGKTEGTGETKVWSYLRDAAGTIAESKTLLDQGVAFGQTGYWYENQGIYKNNVASGAGVGAPVVGNQGSQWIWFGFQAPRTGQYLYAFRPNSDGVANRVDYGTVNLASGGAGELLTGAVEMNAGEYLYFHSHGGWPTILLATVTLVSGGDEIGMPSSGIRVLNAIGSFNIGDKVTVTGPASVSVSAGTRYRVIRPRDEADIIPAD